MKRDKFFSILIVFLSIASIVSAQQETESLKQKLIDGNLRFVNSQMLHPNISDARRTEVSKGQKPFAVIVACSDSRVTPEIVFDQGLGDMFVIRTAGGVVDAAVKGGKLSAHLDKLIAEITPSVEKAKKEKGDLLDSAIKENVKSIVDKLKNSKPVLHKFVHDKKVEITGAYYSLEIGEVTLIK